MKKNIGHCVTCFLILLHTHSWRVLSNFTRLWFWAKTVLTNSVTKTSYCFTSVTVGTFYLCFAVFANLYRRRKVMLRVQE